MTRIDIPENLRELVNERAAQQGYGGPQAYVLALIREDLKQPAQQQFSALIQEGIDSGDPVEVTAEYWEEIKRNSHAVRQRLEAQINEGIHSKSERLTPELRLEILRDAQKRSRSTR